MEVKKYTLAIAEEHNRFLMGLKNPEHFGGGYWNFLGGKPEQGETPAQAAIREFTDESGLLPTRVRHIGTLHFEFIEGPVMRQVDVYRIDSWTGTLKTPKPTDEIIALSWFEKEEIPYDQMFAADRHWVPLIVEGKPFPDRFLYNNAREFKLLPKSS